MSPPYARYRPRFRMDEDFTVDQGWRGHDRPKVWLVGHLAWFLAGRDADQGWDNVFVSAHDSPEFMTQAQAEAEAHRRNAQLARG